MCYDLDATPPTLGEPVTNATGSLIEIVSTDGTRYRAFHARPERASGAGVVVLPDIRGLFPFYERLALSLAKQGHAAVAVDYFGRTAGTGERGTSFPYKEHIFKVTRASLESDILAAAAYLRSPAGGRCRITVALGFCFGGRQAFFTSAPKFGFNGVIGLYGMPDPYPNGAAGPTQLAHELSPPILAIFGGGDEHIPPEMVARFDAALTAAGVPHEVVTYPGAPHSFFDIGYENYEKECADAARRILEFILSCRA